MSTVNESENNGIIKRLALLKRSCDSISYEVKSWPKSAGLSTAYNNSNNKYILQQKQ